MKDLHCWVQPPCPRFISTLRLVELLDLILKHAENAVSRIAGFEPVSKWVREKVFVRAFFVRFQGIVED